MADVDVRGLQRRWKEQGTVAAARDYVRARLRMGALRDGPSPLPEEAFLDGVARRDQAAIRAALAALGAGFDDRADDFWARQPCRLPSYRRSPCALGWRPPAGTRAERFVGGWLETLGPAELRGLWAVDVLSEPAVTDQERATLRADLGLAADLPTHGMVETVQLAVHYISNTGGHSGPPAIARTIPRLLHGLLRRGLVCQVREGSGRPALLAVLRAILDQPAHLEPSRPEVVLAEGQHAGGERWARGELLDAFGLRGALAVIAALPELAQDERLAASLGRLIPGELGRCTVAAAVAFDLGPALGALPEPLALAFLEAAGEDRWAGDSQANRALVNAIKEHGEGWGVSLRWAAEEVLRGFAARGREYRPLTLLARSLVDARTPKEGGPWLRGLGPELLRLLAASPDASVRKELAFRWDGRGRGALPGGRGALPGVEDLWDRLAADPDPSVRRSLLEGPDQYDLEP